MARKNPKIKTVSYVRVGDDLVKFSELPQEKRIEIATQLKITYLNALFAGQAEFKVAE